MVAFHSGNKIITGIKNDTDIKNYIGYKIITDVKIKKNKSSVLAGGG